MQTRLLEVLVCPLCKGALRHDREHQELICKADKLAFPIVDGIPTMLIDQARRLDAQDSPAA
ncbi:Trm112 family protein [Alcaligenes sp. SDU_A2]|uniref:Trm112 family protein n=1 Tax=Alcaligenes sp. SDU_A2 TaxID=3136634 RepID=UPI002BA081CD|nr:Trm112 family protein [Alcaligenes sp.]HRL27792.1 Trm112 family protein [Alcaligenes sp.]